MKWTKEDRIEFTKELGYLNRTHGMSKTKFYSRWNDMLTRCYNDKTKSYSDYGGRGIKTCEEWRVFENFMVDMYESYLEHSKEHGESNTSIDRVDVNGNYELYNCRWVTISEQKGNKRNNQNFIAVSSDGRKYESSNQSQFCDEHGLDKSNFNSMLNGKIRTHKKWKAEYKEKKYEI